jgi:beta-glucanase (GH16 family)
MPTLLGLLLAGVVVFGLYLWGNEPSYTAPDGARPVPTNPGARAPMPRGDIPGWHQVFADNFNGRTLTRSTWHVYSGQPGGDPAGWFDPSHVTVSNGMLVISGYREVADRDRWATGGVSTIRSFAQTYGKYLVRFRLEGVGIGHTLLLIPADGSWPPELDFSEDNGSGRSSTLATLHYGPRNYKIYRRTPVYLTQWHTLGVQWTPRTILFTLDGRIWSTITGSAVPTVPMALALQTQAWPCTGTWGRCPNASTPRVVRMYVDWVVAYAPARLP